MSATKDLIAKLFGKGKDGKRAPALPRQTVEHDSVDELMYGNLADDSPRFRRLAIEDAPRVPPDIQVPEAPDFTTATPDEIAAWQKIAREAREAEAHAPQYDGWENLTRDVFYAYHHPREPELRSPDQVDPAVWWHAKTLERIQAHPEYPISRNITRDDATTSAHATMALVKELREAAEEALIEQTRQAEEFEQKRDSAEAAMSELESLRNEVKQGLAQGQQPTQAQVDAIRQAVLDKRAAQQAAAQIAAQAPVAFDKAAADAVDQAVQAAAEAAKNASGTPVFGAGVGEGEPKYESPEQALTIADMWANDPLLRAVADLYGRVDKHIRFQRANRIVGGQDEIVDITQGAEPLRRVLQQELGLLADDDLEDLFLYKYLNGELLMYDTVGTEHAGRGPIGLVGDESISMEGERLIWMKAIACCLLNICRREKRDFFYVGFASGNQVHSFEFKARQQLNAQDIVDMASHFFNGGTTPVLGTTEAKRIMESVPEFKKADIVMVGDGEASFGPEDKMIRDTLMSRGVRFHGIAIGSGQFRYLNEYCGADMVVNVRDFELQDPSEATAHLATHIT